MTTRWLALVCVAALFATACENKVPEPDAVPKKAADKPKDDDPGPKELVKEDVKVGDGPVAESGDTVNVHYTGKLLKTNFKFDSSVGKDPFSFEIGKGSVIKGWDQGVVGMKVGGKRKLTIPATLGYGEKGSPPKIPPNAPLVFDVELLSIDGKGDAEDAGAKDTKDAAKKKDGDKKAAPKKAAPKKEAPKKAPAPAPKAPAKQAP